MVKSARREYLETICKRYRKARKKDKKPIMDERFHKTILQEFCQLMFWRKIYRSIQELQLVMKTTSAD